MMRSFIVSTSSRRGITTAGQQRSQQRCNTVNVCRNIMSPTRKIDNSRHCFSCEAVSSSSSFVLLKKRNPIQTTTKRTATAAVFSTTATSRSSNPNNNAAVRVPSSYIAATTASTASNSIPSIIHESSSSSSSWFFPIFMAVAGVSCFENFVVEDANNANVWCWQNNKDTTYYTRMEEATDDDDDDDDEEDTTEQDPYDNLPEEDEPTHCSICMTYRQGPCRPYWRKVEACTKDNELKKDPEKEPQQQQQKQEETKTNEGGNENIEGGEDEEEGMIPDTPCLKYMLPWIDCATGYKNLYSLIELDTNFTEGIAILEKEAVKTLCWAPGKEPNVDWTEWQRYVLSHEDWKMPPKSSSKSNKKKSDNNNNPKISLWKTLDQNRDPELVEIKAIVPSTEGDGILECTYALDQDGNVLGFTYGTKPSQAAAAASASASSSEISNSNGDENDNSLDTDIPSVVELKIKLLPDRTRSIKIKASYTQPKQDEEEGDLDAHVYQSRSYSLKKMANIKE